MADDLQIGLTSGRHERVSLAIDGNHEKRKHGQDTDRDQRPNDLEGIPSEDLSRLRSARAVSITDYHVNEETGFEEEDSKQDEEDGDEQCTQRMRIRRYGCKYRKLIHAAW